jgi:hypothetical protein
MTRPLEVLKYNFSTHKILLSTFWLCTCFYVRRKPISSFLVPSKMWYQRYCGMLYSTQFFFHYCTQGVFLIS